MGNDSDMQSAMDALERLRGIVGDAAIDAALSALLNRTDGSSGGGRGSGSPQARDPLPGADARGERRLVSALFADFAGFTSMVAKGDPESVRELVSSGFAAIVPVIERYDGTVEKFMGDGVMALFGAPVSHEDDASRACFAALGMRDALREFNARRGTDLRLHSGVGTGMVVAGSIGPAGYEAYAAIGSAVNRAARISALAEADEVLVDEATRAAAGPGLSFLPLRSQTVKGFDEPLDLFRVEPGDSATAAIIDSSPFVGRERELESIEAAWKASGVSSSLIVLGEPGIGKSRLLREWLRKVSARGEAAVIDARCCSYDQSAEFRFIAGIVEGLAGVSPASTKEARNAGIRSYLESIRLRESSREKLLSLTEAASAQNSNEASGAEPDGDDAYPDSPSPAKDDSFDPTPSLAELLGATPDGKGLVVACDDLQWCDLASAGIISRLAFGREEPFASESPPRVFWLLASREDGIPEPILRAVDQTPHADVLRLGPLSERDSLRLAASLAGFDAGSGSGTVVPDVSAAGGNPLFIEELALRPATVRPDGRSESGYGVRTGLFALIAARIDALPGGAGAAVKCASALGDRFPTALLEFLAGKPDVNELVARAILVREGDGATLSFRHCLFREVAYDTLTESARRTLHGRAAREIKEQLPEYASLRPELLARHWRLAGEPRKALPYFKIAGEDLYYRGSYDEAARLLEAGLSLARDAGSTLHEAALLYLLGRCLAAGERPESALRPLEEALRIQRGLSNATRELSILRTMAFALDRSGRRAESRAALERALGLAEGAGNRRERSRILVSLAWSSLREGDRVGAAALASRAAATARAGNLASLLEKALNALDAAEAEDPGEISGR